MANSAYMIGRKKYYRPQGVLWSENSGTLVDGLYLPTGYEINADPGSEIDTTKLDQFLILSDDNRSELGFIPNRIEKKERMINGRMRSYHIADKLNISMSWDNLPSRAYALNPNFSSSGISEFDGTAGKPGESQKQHTTDGGAGGVELLDWYENHKGSFWMFLAYDKYTNFGKDNAAYAHLPQYNQIVEVFFSNFEYNVVSRGAYTHDLWNVSLTLEEA